MVRDASEFRIGACLQECRKHQHRRAFRRWIPEFEFRRSLERVSER